MLGADSEMSAWNLELQPDPLLKVILGSSGFYFSLFTVVRSMLSLVTRYASRAFRQAIGW